MWRNVAKYIKNVNKIFSFGFFLVLIFFKSMTGPNLTNKGSFQSLEHEEFNIVHNNIINNFIYQKKIKTNFNQKFQTQITHKIKQNPLSSMYTFVNSELSKILMFNIVHCDNKTINHEHLFFPCLHVLINIISNSRSNISSQS